MDDPLAAATIVLAVATAVLAVTTGFMAWRTHRMAEATSNLLKIESERRAVERRAHLVAIVRRRLSVTDSEFEFQNHGSGRATDVWVHYSLVTPESRSTERAIRVGDVAPYEKWFIPERALAGAECPSKEEEIIEGAPEYPEAWTGVLLRLRWIDDSGTQHSKRYGWSGGQQSPSVFL